MPTGPVRPSAFGIIRVLLGLLLLTAAGLKAHQLLTEPTPEQDLLSYRWFLILWVEVEIALGLWLLSGLAKRTAWLTATLCFAAFAAITLQKALNGEASCGCFGRVEINPWYTFVLDVVVVLALALFRPDLRATATAARRSLRFATTTAAALAIGIPVGLGAAFYVPATLSGDGQVIGDKRVVLLEPEKWVGARFPLLPHIDVGPKVAKGQWTVVLYHHDCPHCQERVPVLEKEARKLAARLKDAQTAMVELAPYAPPGLALLPPDTPCLKGRVSDARDWFVETPVILTISGGVVINAKEGDDFKGPNQARLAGLTPAPGEQAVPLAEGGFDFGFVEPKSFHKVLLAIPNPSSKALTVARIRSECKCMSAVAAEGAIPPGTTAPVRVVLVAPEKPVLYNKRILLQTDDKDFPAIPIPIKAAVGLPLNTEPATVDLGAVASGSQHERTVTIVNRCKTPVRLIYSTSSGSGCFAKVPRDPVPPLGSLAVPVVIRAQGVGRQTISLQIQTDLALQPSVTVPIQFVIGTAGDVPRKARADAGAATPIRKEIAQ